MFEPIKILKDFENDIEPLEGTQIAFVAYKIEQRLTQIGAMNDHLRGRIEAAKRRAFGVSAEAHLVGLETTTTAYAPTEVEFFVDKIRRYFDRAGIRITKKLNKRIEDAVGRLTNSTGDEPREINRVRTPTASEALKLQP
jgi:hypothetical protein